MVYGHTGKELLPVTMSLNVILTENTDRRCRRFSINAERSGRIIQRLARIIRRKIPAFGFSALPPRAFEPLTNAIGGLAAFACSSAEKSVQAAAWLCA